MLQQISSQTNSPNTYIPSSNLPQTARQTQVNCQINELRTASTMLAQSVTSLKERLHPVLQLSQEKVSNDVNKAPSTGVPLCDEMASLCHHLCEIKNTVDDILSRLEV